MPHTDTAMQDCIDACLDCYKICTSEAMGHCLERGGAHTEKAHFTLMMACAEICRTAAHFMLIGSNQHRATCAECARICELCAVDCERLGDMDRCVDACQRCAELCRQMAT
ncbi:MAG TPA: four-helix bundle copper-binding protein [Devosia sp.]|nr:four-helix bundle copper-binding protein [Devosia sp.]